MTKEEIQVLYKEKIIPESREPYHLGRNEEANFKITAYNPMCGDKYFLDLEKVNGKIESGYFDGFGCAISKASTSILLRNIEGKEEYEVLEFCKNFLQQLESNSPEKLEEETLNILAELRNFEGRMDCIKLSWEALLKELTK